MHARVRYVNVILIIDAISYENHVDVDLTLTPPLAQSTARANVPQPGVKFNVLV